MMPLKLEFDDKFIICPEKELALNIDYIKYNNLKGKKLMINLC